MTNLADRSCVPCRGGAPPLGVEQTETLLAQLEAGWRVVNNHHLRKVFSFPNFSTALAFTNRIGEFAEAVNHHPDIELAWGRVVLQVWTHKIGGLHEADFIWAAKADRHYQAQQTPEPTPNQNQNNQNQNQNKELP